MTLLGPVGAAFAASAARRRAVNGTCDHVMTRKLKLLFILDPLEGLKAYKDSSIAMMRAAARRGHEVWALQRAGLTWREGVVIGTGCVALEVGANDAAWYRAGEAQARDFVARLYRNVPVLDSGARGATMTFVQRGVGDVLLAWENEAFLALKEFGRDKFDIVVPSISILAEPSVAVVDKVVDKRGTRAVAEEYLKYLYSEEGQDIAGKHFYRPAVSQKAQAKYARQFPKLNLFTIDQAFGGWARADKEHFADNASFDQIYTRK